MYVPKLTVILKCSFIFGIFMNNKGDIRPSLGGVGSAFHDRQKSNNYVLF